MRSRMTIAALAAIAFVVSLSACSGNTGTAAVTQTSLTQTAVITTDQKDSLGPAPDVAGERVGPLRVQMGDLCLADDRERATLGRAGKFEDGRPITPRPPRRVRTSTTIGRTMERGT